MTLDKIVIDANVVLEWIDPEDTLEKKKSLYVHELLKKGKAAIYAPSFLLTEISNVLFWKKKMTAEDVTSFVVRIKNYGINFVYDEETIEDIIKLMEEHKITSYDAQYVYLAQKMNCKLITFDEKLKEIKDINYKFNDL